MIDVEGTDRQPRLDLRRVREEWLRRLPEGVRQKLLRPRDAARVLDLCALYLRTGAETELAELYAEAYRLASTLEEALGQDASLRYLRDGLVRSLTPCLRDTPDGAEQVARILSRVTDAAWQAHSDRLQQALQANRLERLQQELSLAKRIQERLLPNTVPAVPGYDIAGRVLMAAEVGGDYWSCKAYPEDDIVTFKLADVTGHGIAAATLVAAVKFISGGYYRGAKTAAQVMERTNNVLVRETPSEILVTMVYGWLYPHSHEMSVVNAGHAPVLLRHDGSVQEIEPTGAALGIMECRYRERRLTMLPGDVFVTCSDGVTCPSGDGALGEGWVRQQVSEFGDGPSAALVDRLIAGALEAYGAPLDDMSVLVIRRCG